MKINTLFIGIATALTAITVAIIVSFRDHTPPYVFVLNAWAGAQAYSLLFIWAGNITAKRHIAQLEKIERDEQQRAEQFFDLLGDFVGEDDMELLKQKWSGNGE